MTGLPVCLDALRRPRKTQSLEGQNRAARFETLSGAMVANVMRQPLIQGRHILLVDDVMTSGATLAAAAEAALSGGAKEVSILTLARAIKDA